MDGTLVKLTILPFENLEQGIGAPAGPPFIVQFNPETYTDTVEFEYKDQPAAGETGTEAKFDHIKPRNYNFEFTCDGVIGTPGAGTPASGLSVVAQIELFKQTVGFRGSTHRPPFLILVWGRLVVTTVLETYSISYKLFTPEGLPLRATISASFREHRPKGLSALMENLASPDVDHAHLVREGDRLTTIVDDIYRDPGHYIAVAAANGLDTVRSLTPGSALHLPPVK